MKTATNPKVRGSTRRTSSRASVRATKWVWRASASPGRATTTRPDIPRWVTQVISESRRPSRNFPMSIEALDDPAPKAIAHIGRTGIAAAGARMPHLDVDETPPLDHRGEVPADGFDLGKLGHRVTLKLRSGSQAATTVGGTSSSVRIPSDPVLARSLALLVSIVRARTSSSPSRWEGEGLFDLDRDSLAGLEVGRRARAWNGSGCRRRARS